MILVVTGDSDEGLLKASRALNREAHILGMQGPVAIVDAVFAPEPVEDRRFDIDLTLGPGRQLVGIKLIAADVISGSQGTRGVVEIEDES
jgi:hypothetical protein